jgi:chromatin assembly factor 1 subunit A
MDFLSLPENTLARNADRIRFELSDVSEPYGRSNLEPPSAEEWTIFSVAQNGRRLLWSLLSDDQSNYPENVSDAEVQSTTLGLEDNFEALQTAIVKLIQENPAADHIDVGLQAHNALQIGSLSLKQRFDRAMAYCHHASDFIGAHYWWNASRQLSRSAANSSIRPADDSWILGPMHASSVRSLQTSRSVIERCEGDFVALDRHMQRLQRTVKDMMMTVAKLRNKMWYMTDVKNSKRYEEAKHVALALKTMIYSARLYKQTPNEGRSRGNGRSFGGSLLQKPELQVMDVMKAPRNYGSSNKLSDEQVDLLRKWLSHNNIENFCKGEERIHRFCYEVKSSINRLVGETMAETPVLWASELFHKERAKYEGSSNRGFLGLSSSLRPLSIASEDANSSLHSYANSVRPSDTMSRYSQDLPPLNTKTSFQSLISDKWRIPRDPSIADTSSVVGSPGRAASTCTGDSCSTFWSAPHQPTQYTPSASSLYSRPPSLLSDTASQQPRRKDRKILGKASFLDELRQTLTSLLLSDLGSPVWSCGSETDAWFGNALDQKRIQTQMKKRSQIQRFYKEYEERSVRQAVRRTASSARRSKSLGPLEGEDPQIAEVLSPSPGDADTSADDQSPFSYHTVFRRLIEVFSRHGNPSIKLKALRDLRALVVASLNSVNDDNTLFTSQEESISRRRNSGIQGRRAARHSFSEPRTNRGTGNDYSHTPTSPIDESIIFDSRPSDYLAPTESQIVDALRDLIIEVKPKTLFRDLQFISAFVPGETLNKSDSGTAFLQFGLAALSLKDEICNSMVEIADKIVSQELSRRHPPQGYDMNARPGHAIEDAAGMWIITAKEGNPVAQRELAILYLTHPELLPRVTLPLTFLRDTFKEETLLRRDKDPRSDPQSMCLALHWMQLSANGGDELARNRLRELEEFDSIA